MKNNTYTAVLNNYVQENGCTGYETSFGSGRMSKFECIWTKSMMTVSFSIKQAVFLKKISGLITSIHSILFAFNLLLLLLLQNDLLDKLTPVAVDFKFKLHEKSGGGRQKRELKPIIDQYIPTSVRTEVTKFAQSAYNRSLSILRRSLDRF